LTGFAATGHGNVRQLLDHLATSPEREDGQDMIEYALLAAIISVVAIATVILIGPFLADMFEDVVNSFAAA
jgi:Flp pilus assembly pilin Flp